MKHLTLSYCGILVLSIFAINVSKAQINKNLEAELATLTGTAQIVSCNNASEGQMVKGLSNGSANSLTFKNVSVTEAGEYFISLGYYSVNERNLSCRINGGSALSETVKASGAWCYQGGFPADYIFKIQLEQGENQIQFYDSPIIDRIVILSDTTSRKAAAIYVSSSTGDDSNKGLTPETAIRTISKVNSLALLPGDSILFRSGDTFLGQLKLMNEGGNSDHPVLIGKYAEGNQPVLDGDGYLSTINIVNSSYIHISDIEIINNGGSAKPGNSEDLRYGIYLQNSYDDGTYFNHYRFNNLTFKNIYPTSQISDNDQTGINAHAINTSGSWGDEDHPARFDDMLVENCLFTRTGRHAAVFKAVNNLVIKNNLFEHVGGAGMVIGNGCSNILVEKNVTNYTGSRIDSRMAGRGSGIWCFHTKNLTVQHNQFKHAQGIKDSYGMHIDIGNRDVVYQYNYSEDNEGGFVEILGKNHNVGYRYNLSVGDGWRQRGNQKGNIFWIAGWSGDPKNPIGSDSVFIYNNSIYVRDTVAPGILIETVTKNTRIYNNILYVANHFGSIQIKNDPLLNDFDHNIWFGNIPATDENGLEYRGTNSVTANPMFRDMIILDPTGFLLEEGSPAYNSGKLIFDPEVTSPFNYFHNNGGIDYYGNAVSTTNNPNRGAFNGNPISVGVKFTHNVEKEVNIYPNPLHHNSPLSIDVSSTLNNIKLLVQVTDINGNIKLERLFKSNSNLRLNTKNLSQGSYVIRIIGEDFIESKILIVY